MQQKVLGNPFGQQRLHVQTSEQSLHEFYKRKLQAASEKAEREIARLKAQLQEEMLSSSKRKRGF
eukprot:m.57987 g.57987  ORF g.57987 m.57987 type:complete len:65 (+) comp49103_c1_seq2:3-197(+)